GLSLRGRKSEAHHAFLHGSGLLESGSGDSQASRLGAGHLTNRVWEWVAVSKALFEAHQRSLEAIEIPPAEASRAAAYRSGGSSR
ncbi:hypothetical protein, partial [Stutzerimonas nitrititolerans]|uniref:hypothetical protein n=1 Tax=Stutzerimonas nitrititolerans TaxID=2482751 RepID=UPI0028AB614E